MDSEGRTDMSGWRRAGYGLLGAVMVAMGFWIFPYQLERGDVLLTILGGGLAVLGGVVVVRAVLGRGIESVEKALDVLSTLAGS